MNTLQPGFFWGGGGGGSGLVTRALSASAESIHVGSVAFQGVDDVHGRDRLAMAVLSVGDGVVQNARQEAAKSVAALTINL